MKRPLTRLSRVLCTSVAVLVLGFAASSRNTAQETRRAAASPPEGASGAAANRPVVELAILLDSSSSMGGLIGQAQTRIWRIVNELALAEQDGKPVALRVALYEYGKNTLPAESFYIRQIVPLTDNLDRVSEELFALEANTIPGGDEWCGAVIRAAVDSLAWSDSNGDLKVIVIAGNEPFTNGPVDYRDACKQAITRGILVDTIHCGDNETGIAQGWADGARRGEGKYMSIEQDRRPETFATPQDAEIIRLGNELNKTYVPYGELGRAGLRRQLEQDRNVGDKGRDSSVERAVTKSGRLYRSSSWDLVDAVAEGQVELAKLEKKDLPPELRELELAEQKAYLNAKAKQRAELQTRIAALDEARKRHVAELSPRGASAGARPASEAAADGASLDDAVIESLRAKAAKKNIELDGTGTSDGKKAEVPKEKAASPKKKVPSEREF